MWYKNEIRRMIRHIKEWKSQRMIYTATKYLYECENDKSRETDNRDKLDMVLDYLAPEDIDFLLSYVCEYYEIKNLNDYEDTDKESGVKLLIDGKIIK